MDERRYILYEVWDPLTRLLHWLNAFGVLLLVLFGGILYLRDALGLDVIWVNTIISLHVYIGYILAAGILIRWIWLFTGSPLSTWRDLVPHTQSQFQTMKETLLFYLKGLKGEPPFYIAHNPLAGIAYTIFLVVAGFQALTGLILSQIPAIPSGIRRPPEFLLTAHDIAFYIIIIYILAHIPAVVIHELVEKKSIISSMVHGRKVFREDEVEAITRYVDSIRPLDKGKKGL